MKIKNKKIILLIIFAIVLLLIPIIYFSVKATLNIPKMDDIAIAEANKKEAERLFAEKEKFARDHKDNMNTSSNIEQSNNSEINDFIMNDEAKKISEKHDSTMNVLKKYRLNEFERIIENLEEEFEENKSKPIDVKNSQLSKNYKEFYSLVVQIINEEILSETELNLLKDYLDSNRFEINKDNELKAKVDKIL